MQTTPDRYIAFISGQEYNTEISINETKTLVISKEPMPYKLSIEERSKEINPFKYPRIKITSDQNLEKGERNQDKINRIPKTLKDVIFNNKT